MWSSSSHIAGVWLQHTQSCCPLLPFCPCAKRLIRGWETSPQHDPSLTVERVREKGQAVAAAARQHRAIPAGIGELRRRSFGKLRCLMWSSSSHIAGGLVTTHRRVAPNLRFSPTFYRQAGVVLRRGLPASDESLRTRTKR